MGADLIAWLVQGAVAATLVLLCVLALRLPVRALFGARIAYALWLLVPGALLAVSFPGPAMDVAARIVATEGAAAAPSVRVGLATALQPVASAFAAPRISDVADIAWLWAFGALAMAWWQWRLQRRFVSALSPLTPRGDGVFVSASTSTGPAVIGALRPRIVLPADFDARYPAAERALVIAHEREHVRRRDVAVNLAVAALRCLHWFNPLLHWAASKFRFDQELACDATVLARHPDFRRAYAGAMLKTQLAVLGLPVGCHWQSSQSLKERILMLKKPLPGRMRMRLGAIVVCCAVVATGFAAWATQPMSVMAPERRGMIHGEGLAFAHVREGMDVEISGPNGGPDEQPDTSRIVLNQQMDLRVAATDAAGPWELLLRGAGSTDRPEAEWKFLRQGKVVAEGRQPIPGNGRTALAVTANPMPVMPQIELSRLPADGVVEYPANHTSSPPLSREPDGSWLDDDSLVAYSTAFGINGGHAVLLAYVGADGHVQRVEVERADPPGSMSVEAATDLLRNRVYVPQRVGGKAVPTRVRIPVNYSRDIPERREQVVANDSSAPAVKTPTPRYPADALAKKIGGGVTLHLLVGVDGKVKDVRVVGSTPKGVFEEVSVEAAKKWTLQPPMQDGKAVEGWVEVPITFEPERPAASQPSGAASATPIDLRMKLDAGDTHASPRIVSRSGETFALRLGENGDPDALVVEGTAKLLPDGNVDIDTIIRKGGHPLAAPRLIVRQGVPGSVAVKDEKSGQASLRLELVASADPESYADIAGKLAAAK